MAEGGTRQAAVPRWGVRPEEPGDLEFVRSVRGGPRSGGLLRIIEADGERAGYLVLERRRRTVRVLELGLLPDSRGRGIEAGIDEHLADWARREGIRVLPAKASQARPKEEAAPATAKPKSATPADPKEDEGALAGRPSSSRSSVGPSPSPGSRDSGSGSPAGSGRRSGGSGRMDCWRRWPSRPLSSSACSCPPSWRRSGGA